MGQRQYNTYIFILFLVIVIGVFASMAQNDYGIILMSVGCFGLALLWLGKLYSIQTTEKPELSETLLKAEYLLMALVILLFGLRALRIRFSFVETIFVMATAILALVYFRYYMVLRNIYGSNKTLLTATKILYFSIILYFISLSLTFLSQPASVVVGAIGFAFALGFIGWYLFKGPETLFRESKVNILQELFSFLNLSPVLLTMILLMGVYMGLFLINILPPIYTGEIPYRYIELSQKSSEREIMGEEKKSQQEIYWEEYQIFLDSMSVRENR